MLFQDILVALRPQQWVKNLFLFAAIIFVRQFTDAHKLAVVAIAFVAFCAAASASYIFNDIVDRLADREHPHKRNRPVASGRLPESAAQVVVFCLASASLIVAWAASGRLGVIIVAVYLLINLLYSLWLKHVVIIDVICIAAGFVVRVIAGAIVIGVSFSPWLVFCTFFLTLFLATTKRKNELRAAGSAARTVLRDYSESFINQMNTILLPLTLVTYTFYTFSSEHSRWLMVTVPVVLYGLLRYVYINERKTTTDDGPTDDLWRDRPLQTAVALWVCIAAYIVEFVH